MNDEMYEDMAMSIRLGGISTLSNVSSHNLSSHPDVSGIEKPIYVIIILLNDQGPFFFHSLFSIMPSFILVQLISTDYLQHRICDWNWACSLYFCCRRNSVEIHSNTTSQHMKRFDFGNLSRIFQLCVVVGVGKKIVVDNWRKQV